MKKQRNSKKCFLTVLEIRLLKVIRKLYHGRKCSSFFQLNGGMSLVVFLIFPLNTHTHTHIYILPLLILSRTCTLHYPRSSNLTKKKKKKISRSLIEKTFEPFRRRITPSRIFLFLTTNLSNPLTTFRSSPAPPPPIRNSLYIADRTNTIISRAVHIRRFFTPHSPLLFLRCFIIVT